ncbi:hypothetical protein [Rugamonas aquatica]|uniref:Uncharacterized protein n=1 Tax=Rugamonas aquatica TaxID=2743357 RepID=A0A6A7MY97_9BURK|nr:hypothetical protein [Rugamonas aquatica]MQA37719.1 hypothetical protein [Rugamonas aquatica]
MNTSRNSMIALTILVLAGCASERSGEPNANSTTSSTGNQSSTTGTMTSGMTGSASASTTAQTSYGVVQAIDQMQRQDVGAGLAGAAAAGGSVGLPTDKVYRVTVRLDDGTTQMAVADSLPSYKIGDRVRYNNGMVSSY